jgi:probable addiction module antidote protein
MSKRKYPASVPYEDVLDQQLKDPKLAIEYLDACLADTENPGTFLIALKDVARAWGISELAAETGLNRENLYKMLSEKGNPSLSSLMAILDALNLRLAVKKKKAAK